jgi:hypothetical protein
MNDLCIILPDGRLVRLTRKQVEDISDVDFLGYYNANVIIRFRSWWRSSLEIRCTFETNKSCARHISLAVAKYIEPVTTHRQQQVVVSASAPPPPMYEDDVGAIKGKCV